jgi:hypothetical protein
VLDLLRGTTEWGPVYFACHDPPVIAYQAPTIEAFLRDCVAMPVDDPRSPIDQVHEGGVNRIWRENPGLIPQSGAVASADSSLREFANTLSGDAMIADLRTATRGDGFSWGRHGPRTEIQRFGTERIWAIRRPPPKPGFFSRLFGR